jgi:hypothetical protein
MVLVVLVLAACGSDSESESQATTTAVNPPSDTAPADTVTEEPATAKPDVQAAEGAARDEVPDVPLWQGTRFRGAVLSDTEICVDRIIKPSSAQTLGTGRTSHVVVSWPDLQVGEPKDGPCAKAEVNEDRAVQRGQRFFLRMDSDAIALDAAIGAAQDGDAAAVGQIEELEARIRARVNAHLLGGGDTSVGGNLLLSAATMARGAAPAGDVERLADARRDIAEARTKLAEEALN